MILLNCLLTFSFDFAWNLKFSVELINNLLQVHHLDPTDKSDHRGVRSVFQFPRLKYDANLFTGLHHIPDDRNGRLDAESPCKVLPVCQQRKLHAAPEDHVVTQLHLSYSLTSLSYQHFHSFANSGRIRSSVQLITECVPEKCK